MTETTKEIIRLVREIHEAGVPYTEIARQLGGIHRATISQWVREKSPITRLSPVYLAPLRALHKKHVRSST